MCYSRSAQRALHLPLSKPSCLFVFSLKCYGILSSSGIDFLQESETNQIHSQKILMERNTYLYQVLENYPNWKGFLIVDCDYSTIIQGQINISSACLTLELKSFVVWPVAPIHPCHKLLLRTTACQALSGTPMVQTGFTLREAWYARVRTCYLSVINSSVVNYLTLS